MANEKAGGETEVAQSGHGHDDGHKTIHYTVDGEAQETDKKDVLTPTECYKTAS